MQRVALAERCFAEPGPYQTPAFATAPALQRTAPQVLRAVLRPGHERSVAVTGDPGYTARYYRGPKMADMRLIVAGAGGRMGRALTRAIAETPGAVLTGALEAPGSELLGKDAGRLAGLTENGIELSADLWSLSKDADGILDFTVPGATIANVAIAAQRGLVHVIGTTGLSASDDAVIKSVTSRAVVVQSGNMSLGVNLLAALVKRVAQSLDDGFDIEILEMHHKAKIDAPSGTALLLGEAAAAGRKVALDQHSARGRDGVTGARNAGDIGFASLRGGTVTGDHSVIFAGPYERIELSHRAEDRMIFAHGALKAAMWAHGKKPGLYSMADVLGLRDF